MDTINQITVLNSEPDSYYKVCRWTIGYLSGSRTHVSSYVKEKPSIIIIVQVNDKHSVEEILPSSLFKHLGEPIITDPNTYVYKTDDKVLINQLHQKKEKLSLTKHITAKYNHGFCSCVIITCTTICPLFSSC